MPDIEFTGPDTATGNWSMTDFSRWDASGDPTWYRSTGVILRTTCGRLMVGGSSAQCSLATTSMVSMPRRTCRRRSAYSDEEEYPWGPCQLATHMDDAGVGENRGGNYEGRGNRALGGEIVATSTATGELDYNPYLMEVADRIR